MVKLARWWWPHPSRHGHAVEVDLGVIWDRQCVIAVEAKRQIVDAGNPIRIHGGT